MLLCRLVALKSSGGSKLSKDLMSRQLQVAGSRLEGQDSLLILGD